MKGNIDSSSDDFFGLICGYVHMVCANFIDRYKCAEAGSIVLCPDFDLFCCRRHFRCNRYLFETK